MPDEDLKILDDLRQRRMGTLQEAGAALQEPIMLSRDALKIKAEADAATTEENRRIAAERAPAPPDQRSIAASWIRQNPQHFPGLNVDEFERTATNGGVNLVLKGRDYMGLLEEAGREREKLKATPPPPKPQTFDESILAMDQRDKDAPPKKDVKGRALDPHAEHLAEQLIKHPQIKSDAAKGLGQRYLAAHSLEEKMAVLAVYEKHEHDDPNFAANMGPEGLSAYNYFKGHLATQKHWFGFGKDTVNRVQ